MAAVNMTEGSISRRLIGYAIPLVLSNLFQLTYNAADSMIVGRFVSTEALAAVGTSAPVTNLLVLGISGLCIGASVIMSEFYGAGDEKRLRREMATMLVCGTLFSLLLAAAGILFAGPILHAIRVPDAAYGYSLQYLRIVFLGVPFTFLYNAMAYSLKSVGDSRTPLVFLIASAIFNVLLDLLLIVRMGLGVAGSALATVISQCLSAVLCIAYVRLYIPLLTIRKGEWKPDQALLLRTFRDGGMTALQQCAQPVGKLLIQGAVNSMGVSAAAAFTAVSRIDDFACLPEQSIASAITTFMAQNRGADNEKRAWEGFGKGMRMEAVYGVLIGLAAFLSRLTLIALFLDSGEETAIAAGAEYLTWMSLFYLLPAMTNGVQGCFRGLGKMQMTLAGTLIQITFRVIFTFLLTPAVSVPGVAFASAIGWVLMLCFEVPVLLRHYRAWKGRERTGMPTD